MRAAVGAPNASVGQRRPPPKLMMTAIQISPLDLNASAYGALTLISV